MRKLVINRIREILNSEADNDFWKGMLINTATGKSTPIEKLVKTFEKNEIIYSDQTLLNIYGELCKLQEATQRYFEDTM